MRSRYEKPAGIFVCRCRITPRSRDPLAPISISPTCNFSKTFLDWHAWAVEIVWWCPKIDSEPIRNISIAKTDPEDRLSTSDFKRQGLFFRLKTFKNGRRQFKMWTLDIYFWKSAAQNFDNDLHKWVSVVHFDLLYAELLRAYFCALYFPQNCFYKI